MCLITTPLTPSFDGAYVSICSNFRPVHSEVRLFSLFSLFSLFEHSHHIQIFQLHGISARIPFLFEWLQPSFYRIHLTLTTTLSHNKKNAIYAEHNEIKFLPPYHGHWPATICFRRQRDAYNILNASVFPLLHSLQNSSCNFNRI
jgi:hypothetical protein